MQQIYNFFFFDCTSVAQVDVIALDPTGALALVYNDHTKPPDVPGMPEVPCCVHYQKLS